MSLVVKRISLVFLFIFAPTVLFLIIPLSARSEKRSIAGQGSFFRVHSENMGNTFPLSKKKSTPTSIMSNSRIPPLLYGTAWKKDRTQELVELAIRTGFRGIDTACQPKHYFEPGVGAALLNLYRENVIKREDVFLQTKYTPMRGQDPDTVPYDKSASLKDQVMQSVDVSCRNLGTTYIDSLVLHSPLLHFEDNMEVWHTFEDIHRRGVAKYLGISNIYDISLLQQIYAAAEVKPSFVQNRFYRESGYDREIRTFCNENDMVYQSFWTLTANPHILSSAVVKSIAVTYGKTSEQIFFSFLRSQGVTVLTGTKSVEHMRQDLEATSIQLSQSEVLAIDKLLH